MKRRNNTAIRFGQTLREYRQSAGFTLPEVQKRSGVSKGLLSEMEHGRGNPSLLTLHKIARALYVSVGDLLA